MENLREALREDGTAIVVNEASSATLARSARISSAATLATARLKRESCVFG